MRRLLLPLPLALLLPACELYTSPVPLDEPGAAPFDETLLGTWAFVDSSDGDTAVILRAGEHEYLILAPEQNGDIETALAHVTVLRGVHLLNVNGPGDSTYSFVRYVIEADMLRYRILLNGSSRDSTAGPPPLGHYHDSDSFRAAVTARFDDPRLFDDEEVVLVRRRPSTETLCVDYEVLTATNTSANPMFIRQKRGQDWKLVATVGPGTHTLKVPYVAQAGYWFGPGETGSSLRRACR